MTWNPDAGCDRISAGCDHCYALTWPNGSRLWARRSISATATLSGPGVGVTVRPVSRIHAMQPNNSTL
ncbi:DUF5131 family protein [Nonomuraea fuscirosea]|uniref:DUF5131 family protein n=1 Tax=Nonomuraea fuscirosea TaxID=1291556 RepID=UPI001C628966